MCNKYLREGVKMTELNSMQWKDKSQWAWIETQEILFKHKENLFLPVPVSPPPLFFVMVIEHWNRLLREAVASPAL